MNIRHSFLSVTLLLGLLLVACGATGGSTVDQPAGRLSGAAVSVGSEAAGSVIGGQPQSHAGPIEDQVSFVDALRAKGYTVAPIEPVQQPFFRAAGTILRLSGGTLTGPADLQAYNYEAAAAADADARQLGPDGNPPTMMISWIAPPHFFHQNRLIVLYVGSDPEVLALLDDLLGPQFAGQ